MRKFGVALAIIGLVGGTGHVAHGAANVRSNCVALLTSAFGPAPTLRVDEAVHALLEDAELLEVPPGALARAAAQSEGTLEECLDLVQGFGQ